MSFVLAAQRINNFHSRQRRLQDSDVLVTIARLTFLPPALDTPVAIMPTLSIQQAFALALQHHQAGRLQQAEQLYRQILAQQPSHAGAIHYLGVLAHHQGRPDVGVELIRKALEITPNLPAAHNNLGLALRDSGKLDEAVAAYREAIAQKPDDAAALCNLGNALRETGQLDQAIAAFQQAIAHKPGYAQAHYNMGNALKARGQPEDAIASLRRAVALNPGFAEARNNLGIALAGEGQFDEAIAIFQETIRRHPRYTDAHYNLGNAFTDQRRFDAAIAAYRAAIAISPEHAGAYNNMANALKDMGRLDEAIVAYRRSIALAPGFVQAHSNLIYTLHSHPDFDAAAIANEQRMWNCQHAEPLKKRIRVHSNDRDPDRRLRIGYVSPDLRNHAVSSFLLPLLANHDHQQVEVFAYAQVRVPDQITQQLQQHAGAWRSIVGKTDADAAQMIREDQIDILVDLAGHTAENRLLIFAQKPAPVQVTYLGYPATTGMDTIDYRFTDALADPPGMTESLCSEKLFRLPQTAWCYQPPAGTPPPTPPPAASSGFVTFGSFNNFAKVNAPILAMWAKILHQVPRSRLFLKAPGLTCDSVRTKVRQQMSQLGIAPDRLDLRGWAAPASHLALYGEMDIALDTFPYHGTTTTCEALWMGVPVITLAGTSHVARVGVSLLTCVGLPELIGSSPDHYVQIATELGKDLHRQASLRSTLRQRMQRSPLMDAPRFARNVEAAYRQMWRQWNAH